MLRARLLAALLRVRPKPNFHRNDDRKLGEGKQGCGRCELLEFIGSRVTGRQELIQQRSYSGDTLRCDGRCARSPVKLTSEIRD
jgi:hypothetical protein